MSNQKEKIIQIISRIIRLNGENEVWGLGEHGNLFVWSDKEKKWSRIS